MNVVLFSLALPICIADLSTFVIPNVYIKILLYFAAIQLVLFGFAQFRGVAIYLVILSLLLLAGLGMGDVKLLAIILLTHSLNAAEYILYIFLIGMVHIVILTAIHRTIPPKIALAPSIFIGLATYLATR